MKTIDLNCDMGESFGTYVLGYDEQAMPFVTSINVACGFHASDPDNMAKTLKLARQNGTAVGAHPAHGPHLIAALQHLVLNTHPLRDPVPGAPEVDDVATGPRLRGRFDQRRLVAGAPQPIGDRGTGDTRPADGDPHGTTSSHYLRTA